jgi:small subunit ribosomal protein S20
VANIESQIKRNRQNTRRQERNKAVRSRLRSEAKKVAQAIDSGEADAAASQLRTTGAMLDKAASRGVIHKRTAARRKSRLARRAARTSG